MLGLQPYCYIVVARITETNQTQTQTYKFTCLHKVSVVFKSAALLTVFDQTIRCYA